MGLLTVLMPVAAHAQVLGECRLPATIPTPRIERPESTAEVRRAAIAGYTLAMTWNPQYCGHRTPEDSGVTQCDTRLARFGFVLHGLWPEGVGDNWPQWCTPVPLVLTDVLRRNLCVTPSAQLMQHEWAKHGSCMAKTPGAYFDRARGLFTALRFPDMRYLAGDRRLTAGRFAAAIARVNPGLRIEMLRVQADSYGLVEELWLCLDIRFRPAACPAGKRGLTQNARIRIRRDY